MLSFIKGQALNFFAVVLLKSGPYEGKVAVIVEIIDHNRVGKPFAVIWKLLKVWILI